MPGTMNWREGDIAYLKNADFFSREARWELIDSGIMEPGATGHPCIILKKLPGGRAVVSVVTAFGSGEHNNFSAPWKKWHNRFVDKRVFRSFQGSECSSNIYKPLQLIRGQSMPKPQTSWLDIRSVWAVPMSVLGRFTKSKVLLKMAPGSLDDLRSDIARRSPKYNPSWELVSTTKQQTQPLPEASGTCKTPITKTPITKTPITKTPITKTPPASATTGTPVPSKAAASTAQRSWASTASKPASTAPRRWTSVAKRTRMVEAVA